MSERINKFSLELLSALCKEKDQVVVSPFSVFQAFSVLSNGATENTLEELSRALHFEELEELNKDFLL